MVSYLIILFRLLQAEEEIENLKKVEPMLRKELDICQEVSPFVQNTIQQFLFKVATHQCMSLFLCSHGCKEQAI